MAMTKTEKLMFESSIRESERNKKSYERVLRELNTKSRMVELLVEMFNISDDDLDNIRRKANEGE